MKYLVNSGVKQIQNYNLDTPLHKLFHLVSKKQDKKDTLIRTKIAKLLIANGADIKSQNRQKFTPLHLASNYGYYKIAKLLIEKGADLNAKTDRGLTPLHISAYLGIVDISEMLLKNGARVNDTEKNGSNRKRS